MGAICSGDGSSVNWDAYVWDREILSIRRGASS
jgi:hypothetical protein